MNKICVLTSGGDAPGMNAAIRAVVRSGNYYNFEVVGVERGYEGLMSGQFIPLGPLEVGNIIHQGGTFLRSARSEAFKTKAGQQRALEVLRKNSIQGIVVIGGDGSFKGAKALSDLGVSTIGIPGTIDNDLAYTEFSLGFDTACNTILDAINKLRDTMESHERVLILQVMGRNCGDLALYSGLAGGAQAILCPEVPISTKKLVDIIIKGRDFGRRSFLMVVAEGFSTAEQIKAQIKEVGEFSVRTVVLGHTQRGGSPSGFDRRLGTQFGAHAVRLLKNNKTNRIVGIKENKIFDIDIKEGLSQKKIFNSELYEIAMM
ncbi:MAG: 6-phosphofructokinase [Clostridiales bacterium]|jgi:6-phosphofructokinase 1|nr:6-phosphofructokinase [Clostridiales bacterium]